MSASDAFRQIVINTARTQGIELTLFIVYCIQSALLPSPFGAVLAAIFWWECGALGRVFCALPLFLLPVAM